VAVEGYSGPVTRGKIGFVPKTRQLRLSQCPSSQKNYV
jgi:hypothetical protein